MTGESPITFNFASPANRRMTGPLPRFIQMLKNPLYKIMLDFERYEAGPIERSGDEAQQRVTLIDAEGNRAIFLWVLSKQKQAPYENCWMTDSVHRINPDARKAARGAVGDGLASLRWSEEAQCARCVDCQLSSVNARKRSITRRTNRRVSLKGGKAVVVIDPGPALRCTRRARAEGIRGDSR